MEIRIYRSLKHFNESKTLYVSRVDCPDAFDYASALSVFRSIYGIGIVVVFVCV